MLYTFVEVFIKQFHKSDSIIHRACVSGNSVEQKKNVYGTTVLDRLTLEMQVNILKLYL